MNSYYTVVTALAVVVSVILIFSTHANATLPRLRKNLFTCIFGAIVIGAFCEYIGVALSGRGADVAMSIAVVKVVEFSVTPLLGVLYAAIFVKLDDKHIKIAGIVVLIHALFECVMAPLGVVFYVDDQGNYLHGPAYAIYVVAYLASAVFLLFEMGRGSSNFQYRNKYLPWVIVGFILISSFAQMIDGETRFTWLSMAISAGLFYLYFCGIVQQTDALTLLLNRYSYESVLSTLDKPAVVLFIDVDDFKYVNDTFGHNKGDLALQTLGRAIYDTYGRFGTCYRYGGDEFCVVLTSKLRSVEELNAKLEARLAELRQEVEFLPGVSVGWEEFDPKCNDLVQVARAADEMMYAVKRQKKLQRGKGVSAN